MPITDKKRISNNRYIAKTMTVLGCKVKKTEAEQFRAAAAALGTTVNAVMRKALDEMLENAQADG